MYWWRVLNKAIFDDQLNPPKGINIEETDQDAWAFCFTNRDHSKYEPIVISLSPEIYDRELLIQLLAHEMVHQWEQQTFGVMRHGKQFFSWRPKLKQLGIPLETSY